MSTPERFVASHALSGRDDPDEERWARGSSRRKVADALLEKLCDGHYYTIRLVEERIPGRPGNDPRLFPAGWGNRIEVRLDICPVEQLENFTVKPPAFEEMTLRDVSWTAAQELGKRFARALPGWLRRRRNP